MVGTAETFHASCHCGTVKFDVTLPEGFASARRCTCSICTMRGAVAVSANLDGINFVQGQEALTLYQFNTKAAKHYFCSKCGIYTHHQRRSNPNEFGVNVACLEGVSPFDFKEVDVFDGVNHHTSDTKAGPRLAGVLRFEAADSGEA
ncbi:GFA family protein [Pacificibacter sp. AS14]|uniref:GFA family protein n=1 Tax=Pacificibacter sp. AS14 TaxID=3135785 RepID=UPI003175887B